MGSLLFLIFRSLVSRKLLSAADNSVLSWDHLISLTRTEWEFIFAMQISEQYSCVIWLPSLVKLLQQIEIGTCGMQMVMELLVAMQFISVKVLDPEIAFKLDSGEESDDVQVCVNYVAFGSSLTSSGQLMNLVLGCRITRAFVLTIEMWEKKLCIDY